jgi:hypothetical protein
MVEVSLLIGVVHCAVVSNKWADATLGRVAWMGTGVHVVYLAPQAPRTHLEYYCKANHRLLCTGAVSYKLTCFQCPVQSTKHIFQIHSTVAECGIESRNLKAIHAARTNSQVTSKSCVLLPFNEGWEIWRCKVGAIQRPIRPRSDASTVSPSRTRGFISNAIYHFKPTASLAMSARTQSPYMLTML